MALVIGELVAKLNVDAKDFENSIGVAQSRLQGLGDSVAGILGGAVVGGFAAAAGAAAGFAASGFALNNSMEQASAKINAFTKNSEETAKILEMVRQRAAETPFAFGEMANSAAALIPVATASGESLEGILETAEILAASNPAEGLEGAAFALREAVSGDFVSLMERFNIPKDIINDLKAQGVPNIEIVRQALQGMGFDTDLVSNLANTAEGRWGIFLDTIQGFAALLTQPIFDLFSNGLAEVNTRFEAITPLIQPIVTQIGQNLAGAIANVIAYVPTVVEWFTQFIARVQELFNANKPLVDLISANLIPILSSVAAVLGGAVVMSVMTAIGAFVAAVAPIAGLIAIGAVLFSAWNSNFGGIQDIVTNVMNALWGVISSVGAGIQSFWTKNGNDIMASAQQAWNQIQNIITGVLTIVNTVVTTVLNAIKDFINKHGKDIEAVFGTAFANIQIIVSTVLGTIQGIINTVLALMEGDFGKAWTEIQNIVTRIIGAVKDIITNNINLIKGIWERNQDDIRAKAEEIWNAIQTKITEAIEAAKKAVIDKVSEIKQGFSDKLEEIIGFVEDMPDRFSRAGGAIAESLRDGFMGKIESLISDARRKLKELTDMLPGSEPKDTTSPLYGLGRRGEALVENFQAGVNRASLALPFADTIADRLSGITANNAGGTTNSWNVTINTTQPEDSVLGNIQTLAALHGMTN